MVPPSEAGEGGKLGLEAEAFGIPQTGGRLGEVAFADHQSVSQLGGNPTSEARLERGVPRTSIRGSFPERAPPLDELAKAGLGLSQFGHTVHWILPTHRPANRTGRRNR